VTIQMATLAPIVCILLAVTIVVSAGGLVGSHSQKSKLTRTKPHHFGAFLDARRDAANLIPKRILTSA
jgi:hypothetical protein